MQHPGQGETLPVIQFVDESVGLHNGNGQRNYALDLKMESLKRSGSEAGLDDSDSESEDAGMMVQPGMSLKPGKKTKGRVKIKMEFIENKLRRYTTFSKRKTGIMKKVSVTVKKEGRTI